tara:strand:- start:9216 stop:9512 length:297 start_codon:yes stop_codon:yes gene_type:complete
MLMGNDFNSIPKCGKSGSGFDPALAPRTCSSKRPIQPFSLVKFSGTTTPACSAISAKLSPASACALFSKSSSLVGILILMSKLFSRDFSLLSIKIHNF